MTIDDIKPGMFLSIPVLPEHIVLFIVNDDFETEMFRTVDITRMTPSFLSYYAVTKAKEVEEFNGDINAAKKKVIKAPFNKLFGEK